MSSLYESSSSRGKWKRSILLSSVASVVYTGLVFGYSTLAPDVQITGSFWPSFGIGLLFAFGTIGVPIVLWIRYRIRGPAILMGFVLLFWHVLIYVPILGAEGGDAPAFALVLFWAPFYLLAYALLAGGEYWLRRREVATAVLQT
ncbi:hypothetical protein [Haloferax volcanii]|uniref:hypothetical protein n=1 Tax=Haloferax volcanii TaxID=2246 RepID=UPI0023DCCF68|nr:hypothetical protein [Haloferax lucentense]WEL28018.1 hypothetical protein SVXHx_5002 [Haloferax lucentense]